MKIFGFIWGIISFVLSVLISGVCYNVYTSIKETSGGVAALSLIATVPLLIILYIILIGCLMSAVITTIRAMFSESKFIKVVSVILIILEVALLVIDVFVVLRFLG